MTTWMDTINQALQNLKDGDRPKEPTPTASAPQNITPAAPVGQLIIDDDDDDGPDDVVLSGCVSGRVFYCYRDF